MKNKDSTPLSWAQLQPGLANSLLLYVASTNHVSLTELGKIEFLIVKDFKGYERKSYQNLCRSAESWMLTFLEMDHYFLALSVEMISNFR